MEIENRINCFQCRHYANTWNPKFPRSCKFFGFKCAEMPSDAVYRSTGEMCNAYAEKRKQERGGSNEGN